MPHYHWLMGKSTMHGLTMTCPFPPWETFLCRNSTRIVRCLGYKARWTPTVRCPWNFTKSNESPPTPIGQSPSITVSESALKLCPNRFVYFLSYFPNILQHFAVSPNSGWRESKKSIREEKEKFESNFSHFERRKRNLNSLSPVSRREKEIWKQFF